MPSREHGVERGRPVEAVPPSAGDPNLPALSPPAMRRRLPEATVALVATFVRLAYLAQFRTTPYWAHPLVDAHL